MFNTRITGIFQACQACIISLSVLLFTLLTLGFFFFYHTSGHFDFERYGICGVLMVLALLYSSIHIDLNKTNLLQPDFQQASNASVDAVVRITVIWLAYIFLTRNDTISRAFLCIFLVLLYLALLLSHRFLPALIIRLSFGDSHEQRTLLIGSRENATQLRHWLRRKEKIGLRAVGWIPDCLPAASIEGLPILGQLEDLEKIVETQKIGTLILLELLQANRQLSAIAHFCEQHGIRFLVVNDLEHAIGQSVVSIQDDGVSFVALRTEPLENPLNRILKRLLDILVSSVAVFLILPLACLIVGLCQLFQSRGPLFFKQKRAGFQNEIFLLYKFRTMHLEHGQEARQATRDDQRIYRTGRIFRRFSIDELPQFWNVLRGEMSVVGPRPHLPAHNDSFSKLLNNYHVRTFVKPGLTGLAQVRGFRGETKTDKDLQARIQSDIYYIENWSLLLDISILLRTVSQVVFPPRSAY